MQHTHMYTLRSVYIIRHALLTLAVGRLRRPRLQVVVVVLVVVLVLMEQAQHPHQQL